MSAMILWPNKLARVVKASLGSNETAIQLKRASDAANVFSITPLTATSWHFSAGDFGKDTISDYTFCALEAISSFFRYQNSSGASYMGFDSSGGTVNALVGKRSASFDALDLVRTNGTFLPHKFDPYSFTSPALLVGAAAGTGGTVGVSFAGTNETDMSMRIHLRTGNAAMAIGTLCTVTFEAIQGLNPYRVAPHVLFSATSATSALEIAKVFVDRATITTALFKFEAAAALTVNTDYYWDFFVCG